MSLQPEPTAQDQRVPELDAIRGLAALGVVITHLPHGFWFGETGVDLFFVLSGYLITAIILKYGNRKGFLSSFYVRRALRIWPIYYLTLIGLVVLNLCRRSHPSMAGWPYYFTYTQHIHRYWGAETPLFDGPLTHTWTLAIEEQFYFIWPFLLLLVGHRYTLPCIGVVIALSPTLRELAGLSTTLLLGHCDGLALGGLLAYLGLERQRGKPLPGSLLFGAIAVVAVLAYLVLWRHLSQSGVTGKEMVQENASITLISLAYFGLVGILILNAGRAWLGVLRIPALCYLGQISYGLYLYHWVLYGILDTALKFGLGLGERWWLDILKVSLSVAVAILSWQFFEQPILALKKRFSYHGIGEAKARMPVGDREKSVAMDLVPTTCVSGQIT